MPTPSYFHRTLGQAKKNRGRPRQPRTLHFDPRIEPYYIFPSVSSASRTCASVQLEVLGYFSITVR